MKPNHIAIIMDGNGRWATSHNKSRKFGHKRGAKSARDIVRYTGMLGIKYLTLYAFSTENWGRPLKEVNLLMALFIETLDSEIEELNDNNVRVIFIGDRSGLTQSLIDKIDKAELLTKDNQGLNLTVALAYGGRWDIINATRLILDKIQNNELNHSDINEDQLSSLMQLGSKPDPDLLIRTGGEKRISNFLLWNIAYTELYFCESLWPDFNHSDLDIAIECYTERKRRYGKNV